MLLMQIHGACLGHQLLQILASNVSRDDLLIRTDSVSHPTTLKLTQEAETSECMPPTFALQRNVSRLRDAFLSSIKA